MRSDGVAPTRTRSGVSLRVSRRTGSALTSTRDVLSNIAATVLTEVRRCHKDATEVQRRIDKPIHEKRNGPLAA